MKHPPLAGIRVLDLTTFLSGPFCTQILGDLGAQVVKVEPFAGDSSRSVPPHFVGEDSAYYLSTNRNKHSIAVDLKSSAGLDIVRRLIAASDVVVENFRPGVCSKLGLDATALRHADPKLIWASISGFGQTGPWRDLPAYDMIVQALSGVMSLTGEPGRPAVRLGVPAGDMVAGMYAVIAITAALHARANTGEGQMIDVAMLDGQLSLLSYQAQYSLTAGVAPGPQAARHDSIPTYRSFRAGDGRELVVTANTERMWTELCSVLGLSSLPQQPEFCDQGRRLANREALWALLEPAFLARTAAAWVDAFCARGVPAALIKTVPEALTDARAHERDMVVQVEHADGRRIDMVGTPFKFDGVAPPARFPPTLGQDTVVVLRDILAMTADEIEAARAAGGVRLHAADHAPPTPKAE